MVIFNGEKVLCFHSYFSACFFIETNQCISKADINQKLIDNSYLYIKSWQKSLLEKKPPLKGNLLQKFIALVPVKI